MEILLNYLLTQFDVLEGYDLLPANKLPNYTDINKSIL